MASVLKRKRGVTDVTDIPQRTKSLNNSQNVTAVPHLADNRSGWEAAFNPPTKTKELVHANEINGDGIASRNASASPEAEDFEGFVEEGTSALAEDRRRKSQVKKDAMAKRSACDWKLSESIGGHMIDVDPVFTQDERCVVYLFLHGVANDAGFSSLPIAQPSKSTQPPTPS